MTATRPFDPFGEDLADPYPYLARMRLSQPVFYSSFHEAWCVTRRATVERVARDTRTFSCGPVSAGPRGLPPVAEAYLAKFFESAPPLPFLDSPQHGQVRARALRCLSPAAVARAESALHAAVDALVPPGPHLEGYDLLPRFAHPLALTATLVALGLPLQDRPRHDAGLRAHHALLLGRHRIDNHELEVFAHKATAWREHLLEWVHASGAGPGGGLARSMTGHGAGRARAPEDVASHAISILSAGYETTAHAFGNTCRLLLANSAWSADGPSAPMVEEALRLDTPVMALVRVARADAEVGGVTVREGERVLLMWGAANRDESVAGPFPDEFHLGRPPESSVSFGTGPHSCIGAPLARCVLARGLDTFRGRFPKLSLDEAEPERVPHSQMRGYGRLCVSA
ncbi:cytochrome P450 [Streptomyces sp. NPDC058701]|uniref:cytochrome P450 n=1 Tax=Streptomyces sp. NPDC058701 TaxID=3346608 RepID=UPI00365DA958